jgi:prepilin-type N-terminal cleavage/methylation domain-containing protein
MRCGYGVLDRRRTFLRERRVTSNPTTMMAEETSASGMYPETGDSTYNYRMYNLAGQHMNKKLRTPQGGFTLIELAIVLFIVALLFVFMMPTSITVMNNQKRELTRQRLKTVEIALANYVAINKRLPCPADGTSTIGIELRAPATLNFSADCASTATPNVSQTTGVVPWVTLGLAFADILDGWDRQISYRVAYGLTRDSALNMNACDPAGTGQVETPASALFTQNVVAVSTVINENKCSPAVEATCTGNGTLCSDPKQYLFNKGFTISDGVNVVAAPSMYTGAAYVAISHGDNGVGAFTNSQLLITAPIIGVAGGLDDLNTNNGHAVFSPSHTTPGTTVLPTFRDAPLSFGTGTPAADAAYFDDIVVRPTVFSLIQRAQIGPRSH